MPSEMSSERLLAEAQQLRNRLRELDSTSDRVIIDAQNLNRKMDSLREYNADQVIPDHSDHNNESNTDTIIYHQPRLSLISRMQRESRMLRRLEQENIQLKCALEDHKQALEMIMAKYRQQVSTLIALDRTDRALASQPPHVVAFNQDVRYALDGYEEKVKEMVAVMQEACKIDEDNATRDEQLISRLEKENTELKRLLLVPPEYPPEPALPVTLPPNEESDISQHEEFKQEPKIEPQDEPQEIEEKREQDSPTNLESLSKSVVEPAEENKVEVKPEPDCESQT